MKDHSSDIKKLVLIVYYAMPLVMFVVLHTFLSKGDLSSDITFAVLLVIAFAILLLLNRKKFLTYANLSGTEIEIKYLTVFLRSKTLIISLGQVEAYKKTKTDLKSFQPYSIKIKRDNKWTQYLILSNKLDKDVRAAINFR